MEGLNQLYYPLAKGNTLVNVGVLSLLIVFGLALAATGLPRNRWPIETALTVFATASAIFFLAGPYHVNVYDEGIILAGALRILEGEIPSADFYANYGPAQFYIVAWLLELCGRTLNTTRIYDATVLGAVMPASWLLLREGLPRWHVPFALGAILLLLLSFRSPLYPAIASIPVFLMGSWFTIRALGQGGALVNYALMALTIAGLMLLRYDFAVLGTIAFGFPVMLIQGLQAKAGRISGSRAMTTALAVLSFVGALLLAVGSALYLLGILEPALKDILEHNTGNYSTMRSLPFPNLDALRRDLFGSLFVYMPLFAVFVGAVSCVLFWRNSKGATDAAYVAIVVLTVVTLVFYSKGIVRVSALHMLVSAVPATILVFLCVGRCVTWLGGALQPAVEAGAAIMIVGGGALVLGGAAPKLGSENSMFRHLGKQPNQTELPTLGLFSTTGERLEALQYVTKTTAPSQRILSATGRHDKVFINDNAFYFISGRLPGTRWNQYDPGVQTSATVQQEMIRELEEGGVDLVVRDRSWDSQMEPNKSADSSGVTLLDDYISENFSEVFVTGAISIYRR